MPNPPYSCSVIIIRENQDGLSTDLYHWAEVPEDLPLPPCPPLVSTLTAGKAGDPRHVTTIKTRTPATRSAWITMVTNFLAQSYPDTPA